jgi:lipopolysaccharide export system protein LptA
LTPYLIFLVSVCAFLLGSVGPAPGAYADDRKLTGGNHHRNQKIYISADKLIADREARLAEFIGNVKATRGATVITTDSLKIYYKDSEKKTKQVAGAETVKKIIAAGSVTIRFGDILAVSQQAVFTQKTRTIVLSGADSKVWSEDKSIAGSKITLYIDENRIKVTSGNKNRVKAVFQTEETI